MTENNNPNVEFKVVSDSSQARADLKRVDNSLNKVENSANATAAGLASLASKLATAFAGASLVAGIVKTSDAFTNLQNKLKLVTTSTQQLVNLQDDLINLANATRASVDSTSSVYASFAKSVKGSQQEVLAVSKTVQQAIAMSGASGDAANAAMQQLSQGLQSGVLRGEELNSVMEQTPALARAIAAGMGKNLGELRELGASGALTAGVVFNALQKQAEVVNKEFERTSITIGQARQNLAGAAAATAGEVFTTIGLANRLARNADNLSKKILANKDAIVQSSVLSTLALRGFFSDVGRVAGAFNPLFAVVGQELERMMPVVRFMRLNLASMFNIETLVQYGVLTRYLGDQLAQVLNIGKNTLAVFGADFKPDFFNALRDVVQSKSIPELESRVKSLAKVIDSPTGLGFFKEFGKVLTGDTKLVTAMLDAISIGPDNKTFRDLTSAALDLRQFLAMLGLVENKLFVVGNVRLDKLLSFTEYMKEIARTGTRTIPYALSETIAAVQRFTLGVGSYFLEASRQTSGLASVIFNTLGKATFALAGFSATTDRVARGVYNTLKTLGLQYVFTGALAAKFGAQVKNIFTSMLFTVENLSTGLKTVAEGLKNVFKSIAISNKDDVLVLLAATFNGFLRNTGVKGLLATADAFDVFRKRMAEAGGDIVRIAGHFGTFIKEAAAINILSTWFVKGTDYVGGFGGTVGSVIPKLSRLRDALNSGIYEGMAKVFGSDLLASVANTIQGYWLSAQSTYDKIITMTSVKLAQVEATVREFATKVKFLFFDIYDKVVGHSYWPDMIEGIIAWSKKLDKDALTLVEKFADKTKNVFKSISKIDITDPFGKKSFFNIDEEGIRNGIRIMAGAVILGIGTALFSPALFAAMGSFLAFEIAKSVAVSTDKMLGKVFNVSAFEEIGKSIGAAAGSLIKTMVLQIPDMFSAILQFSNGFLSGFLNQFGLIGDAIKGIASLLTGGNIGLLPLMLFGAAKAEGILKSLGSIFGETKKIGDAAKGVPAGGLMPNFLGKLDVKFATAAVVALMSAISSEVSIFKAAMTAAPLLLVAFLGTDVTGKLIISTIGAVLTKVTASIAASTAAGGLVGRILERMLGSNGAAVSAVASSAAMRAKSAVETVFGIMNRVTDEENRKAYLNGQKSFGQFAMGVANSNGDKKAAASSFNPGNLMGAMRFNEAQQEQKKVSDGITSWLDRMKAQIKEKGGLLRDILFGAGNAAGVKASFTSNVSDAATLAKNSVAIKPSETVMNKAVGLDQAALAANLANATSTVSGAMANMSVAADKAGGPGGLMSRLFFGKAGAIVGILLLSNLIAKSAEAGVKDTASKAMEYLGTGLELGFIGAMILGSSGGRAALRAIAGAFGKVITYLARFRVIGVVARLFITFGAAFKGIMVGVSAFIAGLLTIKAVIVGLVGFSLYSIFFGEGDSWLDRMLSNLKGIANALANIAGFNDIWPDESKMKPLRFATQKSTVDAAKSIGVIDKGLSKQVESRIDGINFSTLTQTQAAQLQSYNKMIAEQVKNATGEIKELGEVQESTVTRIKDITAQQEKMIMKLKKGQSQSMLADVMKLQVAIDAPTNTKAKGLVDQIVESLVRVANTTPLRFVFPSISIAIGGGLTVGRNVIDEQIDGVIRRTIVQRKELREAYQQVGRDLSFSFEKIGEDAPLLDAEKYNKPIAELTAAVANSIKELQDAEEGTGFFAKLGFGASDDAKIVAATDKLYANTKALREYTEYVRGLAQTQSEINAFQNIIGKTMTALDKLGIKANTGDLLSNEKSIQLQNYIAILEDLEKQLKQTANTAEAKKISAEIDVVKVKIDNNINTAEVRGTVKKQLEGLIKDSGISGVDWSQLLALKPDVRERVLQQMRALAVKVRSVSEIPAGSVNALENSAKISSEILTTQQAITGVINSSASAAENLATKLMSGAAASAGMLDSARILANPGLGKKLQEAFRRQEDRQASYLGDPKTLTAAEAKAALADEKLINDTRAAMMGNAPKQAKSYLDIINEKLNKAGVSINAEKLFAMQPETQTQVAKYVNEILVARDKLTKLPVSKSTGLPDMKQAGALQKTIDDTKIKLDKLATTYTSFDDLVSDKFKLLPDKISPETVANLSNSGFQAVMKIATELDARMTQLKFDPSKSLMENFANFKDASTAVKTASADIAKFVGVSIEDSLKALGIDWQDLFGLKPESRQKLLDTAKEIILKEKELEQLRKNPTATLDQIAAAEAGMKALKAAVDGNFTSYNSLKALGDTFTSNRFFKLPEEAQMKLMELGAQIAKIEKELADFQVKGIDMNTEEGRAKLKEYAKLSKQMENTRREVTNIDFLDKSIQDMTDRLSKLGFNIDPLVIAKLGSDIVDQMRANLTKLNDAYARLNAAAPGSPEAKQASGEIKRLSEGLRTIAGSATEMSNFSNSMVSAGSQFVKGILTNTGGAWSGLLNSVTGTVVDTFSNRVGEYLFRDLANSVAGELFGGDLGSSAANPMYVRDVDGGGKGGGGGAGGEGSSDFVGPPSSAMGGAEKLGGMLGFGKVINGIKTIFGEKGLFGQLKGLFSGGEGGGGGFSIFSMLAGGLKSFGNFFTSLFGFSDGGYTGGGGKFEPKGIVHGGEFVINKEATQRLGLGYLSKLNSFKGYSSGGLVGGVASDSVADTVRSGASGGASVNQVVNLGITGDISRQTKAEIYKMLPSIAEGVNAHNREKGYKG